MVLVMDAFDPRLAPLQAKSLANLPPAVVVTAEFDPLRDSGAAYADALRTAGGKAEHIPGPGMIHGFFDIKPPSRIASTASANCCGATEARHPDVRSSTGCPAAQAPSSPGGP